MHPQVGIWASHQLHIHGFCKCSAVHWWFWKVNVKQMYKTCVRKANGKCPSNVWFAFVPMLWRAHQSGFGLSSAQYPLSSLLFGWGHGSGTTNSHVSCNSVYTVMSILYHHVSPSFLVFQSLSALSDHRFGRAGALDHVAGDAELLHKFQHRISFLQKAHLSSCLVMKPQIHSVWEWLWSYWM